MPTLIVADMPGLSLRGSGYSTLKALPDGSSLYVNLITCSIDQRHGVSCFVLTNGWLGSYVLSHAATFLCVAVLL
jgi:hypothetical protein